MADDARATLDDEMSEDQLLDAVIEAARSTGWLVAHIPDRLYKLAAKERRFDALVGAKGLPDLIMAHETRGEVIFAELKTMTGELDEEQIVWLAALTQAELNSLYWSQDIEAWRPAARYALWRPSQWSSGEIEAILKGERG